MTVPVTVTVPEAPSTAAMALALTDAVALPTPFVTRFVASSEIA